MTRTQTLILAALTAVLVVGGALWFLIPSPVEVPEQTVIVEPVAKGPEPEISERVIGSSVEGSDITAVSYGNGDVHLLFVGGMHGGYEWNSTLLAYQFIDYLEANPDTVPEDITVSVIPSINPDGLYTVTGKAGRFTLADIRNTDTRVPEGRFNANGVDLNRNFDCKWAPKSTWKGNVVSAGTEAFSEPEAIALRNFVTSETPDAVVFWHSQANNVYASECEDGVLPETLTLMNTYSSAAGYGAVPSFDAYPITGDAEGWLASIGIPAVTVELKSFKTTEWTQNLAGINAVLGLYSIAK